MSDIREALPARDRTRESAWPAGQTDASGNMFEEARTYLENASAIRAQFTPHLPDGFPSADQILSIKPANEGQVQTIPAADIGRTRSSERPPGQSTEVRAPGSLARTTVRFDIDSEGHQIIRDHLGFWTSRDGGETWTTGEPNYRIRRGTARIDEQGNYTFENRDYGVTTTMTRDGRTTVSMRAQNGENFSLTRNERGETVSFTTLAGEWTRSGNAWRNERTGDVRHGNVALTDFGQFTFSGTENGRQISDRPHRTEQMARAEALRSSIERTYGVEIMRPGDPRTDYRRRNIAGMPTEEELSTLQSVLERTDHETYRGMRIWFVRPDEMRPGDAQAHYGHYVREAAAGQHRCSGCAAGHVRATEGHMVIMPSARQSTNEWQGLEGLLLHELMHHEQGQRFGHSNNAWGRKGDSPVVHDSARRAGWVYSERHGESLLRDREGGLWRYHETSDRWRWSGGIQPIGPRRLNSDQMLERAAIRPATRYNTSPDEGLAEGGAMFRMAVRTNRPGTDDTHRDRQYLAENSPDVYRVVRNLDQDSIDRSPRYAADENGNSRYVRDLRGRVVPISDSVIGEIQQAEAGWAVAALEIRTRRGAQAAEELRERQRVSARRR